MQRSASKAHTKIKPNSLLRYQKYLVGFQGFELTFWPFSAISILPLLHWNGGARAQKLQGSSWEVGTETGCCELVGACPAHPEPGPRWVAACSLLLPGQSSGCQMPAAVKWLSALRAMQWCATSLGMWWGNKWAWCPKGSRGGCGTSVSHSWFWASLLAAFMGGFQKSVTGADQLCPVVISSVLYCCISDLFPSRFVQFHFWSLHLWSPSINSENMAHEVAANKKCSKKSFCNLRCKWISSFVTPKWVNAR